MHCKGQAPAPKNRLEYKGNRGLMVRSLGNLKMSRICFASLTSLLALSLTVWARGGGGHGGGGHGGGGHHGGGGYHGGGYHGGYHGGGYHGGGVYNGGYRGGYYNHGWYGGYRGYGYPGFGYGLGLGLGLGYGLGYGYGGSGYGGYGPSLDYGAGYPYDGVYPDPMYPGNPPPPVSPYNGYRRPVPAPLSVPADPNATFPYDGGPLNPVPLPQPRMEPPAPLQKLSEPPPNRAGLTFTAYGESRSIPVRTPIAGNSEPAIRYPAYGEQPSSVVGTISLATPKP